MDTYYDGAVVEEDEGPIIQEIPGALMVGDYIEIHGVCRGPEVIVQLLSQNDPDVLPLHVRIAAGGPVLVKSQNKQKVERQEHNVRMGLQPNMDFELCIFAMEEGYEIKLNKKSVCVQKHLTKLEDVSAISMDGDADFTSVEFKDIYGDEEDEEQIPREQPEQGLMRVQEKRESFSRHRGSPILIRSSIRKSNRSNREVNIPKSTWPTSEDLSRPDYEVEPVRDINLQNTTPQVNQYQVQPTHTSVPVEMRKEIDTPSPKSKSRFSWKLGSRKSLTVDEDKNVYPSGRSTLSHTVAGDTHMGSFKVHDGNYGASPRPGSQTMYAGSLGTLNASSGSLADKHKKKRSSLFGKLRKSKGSESDISINETEKKKKRGIKNPFKQRKSITVAAVGDVRQSYSLPDVTGKDSLTYSRLSSDFDQSQPLYVGMAADRGPVRGPVPKAVWKQPAPEIAAYVASQKAVPEFENFNLTSRDLRETPSLACGTCHSSKRSSAHHPEEKERKLKGTAPELADMIIDSKRAGTDQNTTLTNSQRFEPVQTHLTETVYVDPNVSHSNVKLKGPADRYPTETTLETDRIIDKEIYQPIRPTASAAVRSTKSGKLEGPAPEIAAELYERHRSTISYLPETTVTGSSTDERQSYPVIERPVIDRDPVYSRPQVKEQDYRAVPVYTTRPVSANRVEMNYNESDASSIHSDGEFYLDVGKSDYYYERRRSLKSYRSRRSRRAKSGGVGSSDDSPRSSISSLKASDKVITPRKWKGDIDSHRQVNSWLNGYSQEPEVYPSRPDRPLVYAAAPAVEHNEPIELVMHKEELSRSGNAAGFPLALTPGRSAHLSGRFLMGKESGNACFIRLKADVSTKIMQLEEMILMIGTDGAFSITGTRNGNQYTIKSCMVLDICHLIRMRGCFAFDLHARGVYFGITVNEYLSFIIREEFDPSTFKQMELLPCSSAELEYFSVANDLIIPVTIPYPITTHLDSLQSLTLNMRMDADAKCILLEFETQANNRFDLVLDFENGYVYSEVKHMLDKSTLAETARQSIPFVPEQIRQLVVLKTDNEDTLTVFANQKEIFQQSVPVSKPFGRLSQVRVSGDMLLLGTRFG